MLALALVPALLGALTSPARLTLVGAPLVGAVAVAVVLLPAWGLQVRRPSPRALTLTGVVGALAVPFVVGLPLLGPAGTALLGALAALGVVGVRPWTAQVSWNRHVAAVPRRPAAS